MRVIAVLWVVAIVAACTKRNPEACCVDATDCAAVGLPEGSGCEDGLSCRENRCVELACSTSAQCDLLAPYCVGAADGTCEPTCDADDQCPGFGQSTAEQFCEMGSCVMCRTAMNDCALETPICDTGACRRCESHAECGSGVCASDGSCALESDIAYVMPLGSPASGCTRADPCTISRALQIAIGRPYVHLAAGSYINNAVLTVDGRKHIIGTGSPRPTITRTSPGPIITLAFGADVTFDNVEISGATTSGFDLPGYGIECSATATATARVLRSAFTNNASAGIRAQNCTIDVHESTFDRNYNGISVTDTKVTIERSTLVAHTNAALSLDGGLFIITNNFLVRNGIGADLFPNGVGTVVEFNTIADNKTGVLCQVINNQGNPLTLPKNVIARNDTNVSASADCVFSGSILVGSDIAGLKFKSPDAPPYDYHLMPGSFAIDQISNATQTRDFDGEVRPNGAGFDFGADEVH